MEDGNLAILYTKETRPHLHSALYTTEQQSNRAAEQQSNRSAEHSAGHVTRALLFPVCSLGADCRSPVLAECSAWGCITLPSNHCCPS
jgi:hypothetical protein